LKELNDPVIAYRSLANAINIDAIHSESFLQTATEHWLDSSPDNVFQNWRMVARKLAGILRANHRDHWLEDFLDYDRSPPAIKLLRSAIAANGKGDYRKAVKDAESADEFFERSGNLPGIARSRFELVYALHRQSKGHECLLEARRAGAIADANSYTWIQTQLLIEKAICHGLINDFGQEGALIGHAVKRAEQFHYPTLQLRALGIAASFATSEGRLRQSWSGNEAGLKLFWEGAYDALRGYQFYTGLTFAAQQTSDWHLAAALQREAIAIVEDTKHLDFKAMAHFELGTAAEMAGDSRTALEQFEMARVLFEGLPANSTTRIYQANTEIALAELEAREGKIGSAVQRLEGVKTDISHIHNFNVQLSYWRAWAEVERHQQDTTREAIYLNKVVAIGRQGFHSMGSEKERWDWRRIVGPAFSRLVELEINGPHDAVQALADWESVHAGESSGKLAQTIIGNLQAKKNLLRRAKDLDDATLISIAIFGNRMVMWLTSNRGIFEFKISDDWSALKKEIGVFRELCANPGSSLSEIRTHGARIYKQLFAGVNEVVSERHNLFFEADGILSAVPWSAMVTSGGEFLGESHAIAITPGLLHAPEHRKRDRGGDERALIVVPGAVTFQEVQYLPLADAEIEASMISGLYPGSICLRNQDASRSRVLKELPQASIFHFAGHALSYDYGGHLLLSSSDSQGILSSNDLAQISLNRCRLVVLSACSTATAEQDIVRDPNGLVRAFLAAGASEVVASHWDVDSAATARLMTDFYRELHAGQPAGDALRLAREQLRLQFPDHPYYWASFEVFEAAP